MFNEFTFIENLGRWDFTVPVDSYKTRTKVFLNYFKTWANCSNDWVGINSYDGIFLTYQKIHAKQFRNIENAGYVLEYKSKKHIKPIDVYMLVENKFKEYVNNNKIYTNFHSSIYRLEIGCSVKVNYVDKGIIKFEFIGYGNPPDFKLWSEDLTAYLYIDYMDAFEDKDYFKFSITTDFTGWVPGWFTNPIKKECAIKNNNKLSYLLKTLHEINTEVRMRWGTGGSKFNIPIYQYGFKNE